MSKVLITRSKLDGLATTIAAKSGATLPLTIAQMDAAVQGISGGDVTVQALSVTSNGTYTAPTGSAYSPVTVAVPTPTPSLQSKTATPTEQQQTVQPDSGYDGLSSVQINAMPSGTAGTPTATKGSVSNHSVSVTPSVTNTTGYITGSTKTGTAVTVSASELVSGSETKTANGTYDVTNLAELVVNVASPVKTATGTFTGNGTRTIDISSVTFEPDLVYFTSDPGTTSSSGTVAAIIVRDMMTATRYRNNSTTNSHYAIPGIVNLNTSGSSYSWRATYDSTNSKLTLYCYSSNARGLLTNGRTYTYTFVKWT